MTYNVLMETLNPTYSLTRVNQVRIAIGICSLNESEQCMQPSCPESAGALRETRVRV